MRAALFFAAAFAVAALISSGANAAGSCGSLSLPNSSTIDLSNVPLLAEATFKQNGGGGGTFKWGIDPCGKSLCGATSYLEQDGCQVQFLTKTGSPTWNADHIEMVYGSTSSGFTWSATLKLYCGTNPTLTAPTGTYDATIVGQDVTLVFYLQSSSFCVPGAVPPPPGPPPAPPGVPSNSTAEEAGGLTWGGVFLICFWVPLGLYVIGFVAWNYKQGKTGRDLAPHPEFWGSLPGLFKDGLTFTWSKIRGTPWESSEGAGSVGGTATTSAAATGSSTTGYTTV